MKKTRKAALLLMIIMGICPLLIVASALSNLSLPKRSAVVETLSVADKTRLAELFRLRRSVGNSVWPGWAVAELPAISYNESYAFLVSYSGEPPAGWVKVPANIRRGGAWDAVPGEKFEGQPYYRQVLSDAEINPENFAVRVGERWVSSLQTSDWMKIQLTETVRGDLPSFLRPIFPYRLFVGLVLGSDDKYISAAAHESFHAYQGLRAPQKFSAAETAARLDERYPWEDETLSADWSAELKQLAFILRWEEPGTLSQEVRRFLSLRSARRQAAHLSPELIAYEQQREWLEGLARYAELEIWRQAGLGEYTPLPATAALPNFERYQGFEGRWNQELEQMPRMFDDKGDGRFYSSGMAQAYLLDRLLPHWKEHAFEEGIWLETLLAEAVKAGK